MDSLFELSESKFTFETTCKDTKLSNGDLNESPSWSFLQHPSLGAPKSQQKHGGFQLDHYTEDNAGSTLPSSNPSYEPQMLDESVSLNSSLDRSKLEVSLKKSRKHTLMLAEAVESCEKQLQVFRTTLADAQGIMKELTNKWAVEKEHAEELREEVSLLKQIQMSEHPELKKLREQNRKLSDQVKRNAEVFEQMQEKLRSNDQLERTIKQRDGRILNLKNDKDRMIRGVQSLVRDAQRVLSGPDGKKRLIDVIKMMAKLDDVHG